MTFSLPVSYLMLAGAILFEVIGTVCMKLADGLERWPPFAAAVLSYCACLALLTLAIKRLDLGTTYAIWGGVGTAVTAVIGIVYFKESIGPLRVVSLALIVLGVIGLHLSPGSKP